jgi:hypothetical protein
MMNENLTFCDLKQRWENVLKITQKSVSIHPIEYRQLKSLARDIVYKPLDIGEYVPTVKKLTNLLEVMDASGKGTIFHIFNQRMRPEEIWQNNLLRVECRDLLAHLEAFDQWRIETHRLKIVK